MSEGGRGQGLGVSEANGQPRSGMALMPADRSIYCSACPVW